jgi:hypothetical protein
MTLDIERLRQAIHVCEDFGCETMHGEELPSKKMKVEKIALENE